MKTLIYTTTAGLLLAGSMTAAQAAGVPKDAKAPHLTTTAAVPSHSLTPSATYQFRLHASGYPISQLTIDIPEGVRVEKGVTVTDQTGRPLNVNTTFSGKKATVVFAQPVAKDANVTIRLNSVKTSTEYSRDWLFPISWKSPELATDIPLGIAHINTYE